MDFSTIEAFLVKPCDFPIAFSLVTLVLCWICLKIYRLLTRQKFNEQSVFLITGGCMGIGRQMALRVSSLYKSTVIILDVQSNLEEQIVKEINQQGGKGYFYKCDVSDYSTVGEVIAKVYQKFDKVDVLINNAGIVAGHSILDSDPKDFQKTMNVNYFGNIWMVKHILPRMKQRNRGHIVTIASVVSYQSSVKAGEYAASKHAVMAFHNTLRYELLKEDSNIDTTIVHPYCINTGMFKGFKANLGFYILSEQKVAKRVITATVNRELAIAIPGYFWILWHLMNFLPLWLSDWLLVKILDNDCMSGFVGRAKQDQKATKTVCVCV